MANSDYTQNHLGRAELTQLSLAIVGVDHRNKDKSDRRFEILLCAPGEEVHLVPEPKNPVDPQAVAVFSARGTQLGYVKAERAQLIKTYLARGRVTAAVFQDRAPWGCVIRLGLDGQLPSLPSLPSLPELPPESAGDDDFYPDWEPPDE